MENTALILSIVSFIISIIAYFNAKKSDVIVDKPTLTKKSVVFFKSKKPEQVRFEKKIKKGEDIKIEEIC